MLSPGDKAKMGAARELIRERRYDEALALLEGINHPTANDWRKRLNAAIAKQPKGRTSLRELNDEPDLFSLREKPVRKSNRRTGWLIAIGLIIAVIAAVSLIQRQQQIDRWNSQRSEASAALNVFCSLRLARMNSVSCGQWVTRLLNDDISYTDDILSCDRRYNRDGEAYGDDTYARLFIDCLARSEIYLPN